MGFDICVDALPDEEGDDGPLPLLLLPPADEGDEGGVGGALCGFDGGDEDDEEEDDDDDDDACTGLPVAAASTDLPA